MSEDHDCPDCGAPAGSHCIQPPMVDRYTPCPARGTNWTYRPHAREPWFREPCYCALYQERWLVARSPHGGFLLKDRRTGITEPMSETNMEEAQRVVEAMARAVSE